MNLTKQMLMREMLNMLKAMRPYLVAGCNKLREESLKIITLAERELSYVDPEHKNGCCCQSCIDLEAKAS